MLRSNRTGHKWLWHWFRPDYIADTVAGIDFAYLRSNGIRAIYIDLDGTVVNRGTFDVPAPILQALRKQSLDIYIATNRPVKRDLKNLKDDLGATGVVHPQGVWCKPLPPYYRKSIKAHGLQPKQVAMIGDRYLQDIFGANSAGLTTIVVRKLDQPANWVDRILSYIEARRTNRLARAYRPLK